MQFAIRLKADLKDKFYRERLSERLMELTERLVITDREEYDILLTDFENGSQGNNVIRISRDLTDSENEHVVWRFSKAGVILNEIIEVYEKNNNTFFLKKYNSINLITFQSPFGGSGLSSIAYTFSKKLALMGNSTLIVSQNKSSLQYFNPIQGENFPVKQLEYLIYKKEKFSIRKYIKKDDTGLGLIQIENNKTMSGFLREISNSGLFEYVIFTARCEEPEIIGDNNFVIINETDIRKNIFDKDKWKEFKIIHNNSAVNDNEEEIFLAHDEEAFITENGAVRIKPGSMFAIGVEMILRDMDK